LSSQTPKGTRDFYPDLMRIQNHIFSVWKKTCLAFGYEEYEAPMFEHLDLYTSKSGDEIVSQLYNFQDKGGRELALRPEITPSLARMINQKGPSLKLPIRWFSIPRLFRYERMQKGRLREFYQLNMDIMGCDSLIAETDLICAVIEMLKAFGLTQDDFCVGISSRRLLSEILESSGLPAEKIPPVYTVMDKRNKISPEDFRQMLTEIPVSDSVIELINSFFSCQDIEALQKWEGARNAGSALQELEQVFRLLKESGYGSYVQLDLSVVRGLAYYTGVVFEVFDRQKKLRALAGGGRYDNLLEHLGGRPVSGVGFGIGDVVLYELLKSKNLLPDIQDRPDYYLVSFSDPGPELLSLARELRSRGRRVTYALQPAKVKKQLSLAQESGARKVIFTGSDKVEKGQYEVKDLEKREQTVVPFEDL
jgi:histidyl-tRNA synthetase